MQTSPATEDEEHANGQAMRENNAQLLAWKTNTEAAAGAA